MATDKPVLFGSAAVDHAVAGLTAGTFTTLVMHPLDLVKVRFQVASSPSLASSADIGTKRRFGTQVYGAIKDAVTQDGMRGLYRGLSANVAGNASSWGLYFLWYTGIKSQMQGGDPSVRLSASEHLLAAAEASAITAMLTNPIWVVKTRMFATRPGAEGSYSGLFSGLANVYRTEGVKGLYKGSLLALVGVTNGSIQFAAYEEIKKRRGDLKKARFAKTDRQWTDDDEKLSNTEYIMASGASKMLAIAVTYPYQVVRARIQNTSIANSYPDIPTTISRTFREEGVTAFYKGLGTNAIRIIPGTCAFFVFYENLSWFFRTTAQSRFDAAAKP